MGVTWPFWSIEVNKSALAVTPQWVWLDTLYLTDVFHVFLVPIALPPPTQLLCYLK